MISEKICKKVKLERIKRGLTQEQLAFEAGLNKNTIWKIETGKTSPSIETIEKIVNALKMDFLSFVDVSKVDL